MNIDFKTISLKNLIIGIFIVFLILIFIIAFFFTKLSPPPETTSGDALQPNYINTDQKTLDEKFKNQPQLGSPIEVVSITPPSGEHASLVPIVRYTIEFDQLVDSNTITLTSQPQTPIKIITSSNKTKSFDFVPINGWEFDQTYTLTLSKNLTSTQGNTLPSDYTFEIIIKKSPQPKLPSVGY